MGKCGHNPRMRRRHRRAARAEMRAQGLEPDDRGELYRSRDGMIFGVCRGIAEYYDFSVFWTRALIVGAAIIMGIWPAVGLYIVAAFLMKIEPVLPLETEEDEEFYHAYASSRSMALHRLKRTYDNLDRRIQRMENAVTARDYDWEERLNR